MNNNFLGFKLSFSFLLEFNTTNQTELVYELCLYLPTFTAIIRLEMLVIILTKILRNNNCAGSRNLMELPHLTGRCFFNESVSRRLNLRLLKSRCRNTEVLIQFRAETDVFVWELNHCAGSRAAVNLITTLSYIIFLPEFM